MSMLSDWKEEAEAAKRKQEAQHPIAALEVDRNVRDAYFLGLVFAALANDYKIDDKERARLDELGVALGVGDKTDVEQAIADVEMASDKKLLIEECARQIANPRIAEHFLSEFSSIWVLGGGSPAEYEEFRKRLIDWMGETVEKALPGREKAVSKKKAISKKKTIKPQAKSPNELLEKSLEKIVKRDFAYRFKVITVGDMQFAAECVGSVDPDKIDWDAAVEALLKEVV